MKKLLSSFVLGLLLAPSLTYAIPVTWDYAASVLQPLQSMRDDEVRVPYLTATSTATSSTFAGGFVSQASSTITDVLHADGTIDFQNLYNIDAQLSSGKNRLIFKSSEGNADAELIATPVGANTGSEFIFSDSPNLNNFGGLAVGTDGTTNFLSATSSGSGTTLPLTFDIDGTEAARIATGGNVGIGTTSPQSKLHVYGSAQVDLASSNDMFKIQRGDIPRNAFEIGIGGGSGGTANFKVGGSTLFSLNNSNFTVGTTDLAIGAPEEGTMIFANDSYISGYNAASTDDIKMIGIDTNDNVVLGNDRIHIASTTGNVGIGTSTPTAPLSLSYNNSTVGNPLLLLNNEDTASAQSGFTFATAGDPVAQVRVDKGGAMIFASKKKQYFAYSNDYGQAIDIQFGSFADPFLVGDAATGNVGIGSTTPSSKLTVAGNTYLGGNLTATGTVTFSALTNCDTIDTDANGVLSCGTDATLSRSGLSSTTPWTTGDIVEVVDDSTVRSTSTISESKIDAAIARDSELHDAVTVSGTPDYITLSGQDIVRSKLDIADDTNLVAGDALTLTTNTLDVNDVTAAMLAAADFGDFTCNGTTCSIDDLFVLNTGDTMTGTLNMAAVGGAGTDSNQLTLTNGDANVFTLELQGNEDVAFEGPGSFNFKSTNGGDFTFKAYHNSITNRTYDAKFRAFGAGTGNEYLEFYHNGTLGLLNSGVGAINLTPASGAEAQVNGEEIIDESMIGRSLTYNAGTVAADSELYTRTKTMLLPQASSSDDGLIRAVLEEDSATTITEVKCEVTSGTSATIQLEERGDTTPTTAGTDVMTSALTCDSNSETTSSFTNAGIAAGDLVSLQIDSETGSPDLAVHITYQVND